MARLSRCALTAAGGDGSRRLHGRRSRAGASRGQAEALTFFIRRLLRRAAWLGWMMPLAAAMSRRLTARRTSSSLRVGADRGRGRLDARLQLALGGLVALGPLGVRDVALLLALDVGHGTSSTAIGSSAFETAWQGYPWPPRLPTATGGRSDQPRRSIDRRPWNSTGSATSRSSPTSTTGSRRCRTASSRSRAPSTPARCASSTSTRWTSSASGASRSRPRTSASSGTATSSTSSTRPATSTSATRSAARSPRARASCSSSTRRRASRPRRWPTATWRSSTTSRSSPR